MAGLSSTAAGHLASGFIPEDSSLPHYWGQTQRVRGQTSTLPMQNHKRIHRALSALGVVIALLASTPRAASAEPSLRSGERVVFYGDSITQQRLYTRYIQQYFYCRYPHLNVHFYNAGWNGDTAVGALSRLDRDVLILKPTVVTLFFGMNDGAYTQTTDAITDRYRQNLEGIITKLQAKGVRVIVFTPGSVDPDKNPHLGDVHYNDNLSALGQAAIDLAKKHNCEFVDVHDPMLAYQTAHKQKNPKFAFTGDGVHPDASGHLVMASIMLSAFHVDPMPAIGTIDVTGDHGDDLAVTKRDDQGVTLAETAPAAVPFWFEAGSTQAMTDSGLANLAEQRLTVKGLAKGAYDLTIDSVDAGEYTTDDLASGILVPGTYATAGHQIHELTYEKESLYYSTWREVRLPFASTSDVSRVIADLMKADDDLAATIYQIAGNPPKSTIRLTHLPGGINLALHKSYVAGDPNTYGWDNGGLTDGSWDPTAQHCFASSDANAFPKTVTIDLGQTSRIATVLLGVPAFGATKTIAISVSADGTNFTDVGTHTFDEAKEARFTYTFASVDARYVRLTYPDHYDDGHGYTNTFAFTEECQVFAAQ